MRITNKQLHSWSEERAALNRARKLVLYLQKACADERRIFLNLSRDKASSEHLNIPNMTEVVKAFSLVYPDTKEADAKLTAVLS